MTTPPGGVVRFRFALGDLPGGGGAIRRPISSPAKPRKRQESKSPHYRNRVKKIEQTMMKTKNRA